MATLPQKNLTSSSRRLGEMLVEAGFVTGEQLQEALNEQKRSGKKLGSVLAQLGVIDEATVNSFLSTQLDVPCIDLAATDVDPHLLKLLPAKTARRYKVVPVDKCGATLIVAMAEPRNVQIHDEIKFMTGYAVEPLVSAQQAIDQAIDRLYDRQQLLKEKAEIDSTEFDFEEDDVRGVEAELESNPELDIDEFDSLVQGAVDNVEVIEQDDQDILTVKVDAPIVKLVNGILIKAYKMKASDIHIEPFERLLRVRYRLDGVCKTMMNLPLKIKNPVVSRVKIMARLDIAERRVPQDGRIRMRLGSRTQVDFRVSVLPGVFGEKVVLRLLDKSSLHVDMTKLGFEEGALREFKETIKKPCGMVLVTGPTGSGKTTTLYSALAELNKEDVNITTIEDPVEYNLMGITQVETKEEIGLDFAAALRSFLRQDPDIMLVGEIRDFETAKIAVQAALTGHLVMSTLHTNDAATAVTRLINMGVEPFLVAYSVNLAVAQRLARRICPSCKEAAEVPLEALVAMGMSEEEAAEVTCYKGVGCSNCRGTGFNGRVALYEVLTVTDEMRHLILAGDTGLELRRLAVRNGMKTLRMSGITKLKEGVTSFQELLRVTF